MLKKFLLTLLLLSAPLLAFADYPGIGGSNPSAYYGPGSTGYESPTSQGWGAGSPYSLAGIISMIIGLINRIIPVLVALALVFFFIGLVRYVYNQNKSDNRKEILWSLVTLFVLLSIWGILRVLENTFLIYH